MTSGYVIRKNEYYDSVFLMGINKQLSDHSGVKQTAVLMGTENNKNLLNDIGIKDGSIDAAKANDLIVAVIADTQEIVDEVLNDLDRRLKTIFESSPVSVWKTFDDGLAQKPNANLEVLSIPGEYVPREARKAIEAGLHVFIFSSNVSLQDELELKKLAAKKNVIVMGPDCGTSIIGGVGIGFANVVRQGSIGVIGASGTGLQEFTCQVHNAGQGISHAIGTGTNDVSDTIGGLTSFAAIDALEADTNTKVIAFVSKPPGKKVREKLIERLKNCSKPTISCFLGESHSSSPDDRLHFASTIDLAVDWALHLVDSTPFPKELKLQPEELTLVDLEAAQWTSEQQFLRGVFAGGTYCYQSQQVLRNSGLDIYSNAPLEPAFLLDNPDQSRFHSIVDMGDEYYTLGKPHPMIDGSLRNNRILAESLDPQVAVIFLDFILGYNASSDPAGELLNAISQAQQNAANRGSHLTIVASICGTDGDPQDLNLQSQMLKDQDVYVFNSNSKAALFCARLLGKVRRN
jgi:succinyl-CoA synthetase alpha subunit